MKLFGFDITMRREQRVSPENPNYSLSDPRILDALGIGDGLTGVTPATAMQVRAVFSCVRVIAEAIGQLPLHLYRRVDATHRERVTDDARARIVARPNPIMSRSTYFEQQTAQMLLWGAAYSQRIFDRGTDETIALYPQQSGQVLCEAFRTTDARGYPALGKRFRIGSELLGSDEILHVPLLTLDGYTALSPIKQNRLALNVAYQQQKFSERFYANGVKLSGVLEHPQKLSKEAGERLRENWTAAYAGAQNAGKVAILEEGMKFNALLMPLDDAQYIETAKLSREEIAGIFRMPPHMIGALDRATFSNIEQQSLEFAVYTLTPYLVKWEKALAETLLLPSMQDEFYFRFNMDALLRGDMKSRYEAYAQARQWGWLSANDILDLEDRNAIENGDIYLQPMNMIPAGTPVETYLKGATSAKSEGEKNAA